MKQLIIFATLLVAISCKKEEEFKDYTCKCIYVEQLGDSVLVEKSTLKRASYQSADYDCFGLEGKYLPSNFGGNCLIE